MRTPDRPATSPRQMKQRAWQPSPGSISQDLSHRIGTFKHGAIRLHQVHRSLELGDGFARHGRRARVL